MTIYNTAKEIVQRFVSQGFISYFAGGWVRDYLLKHPSDDIDIVTSASVEQTLFLFDKTIPVGVNFGIVVVVENGHQFEVATFRTDEGFSDGRRPDTIKQANPEEDAQRRDFTINGLFYDPITEQIHDYVNGKKDIELGIVRAIGDPTARFQEDRLRMIRAVRYAARFHFTIENKTKQAIIAHAKELFPSVAVERIFNEFEKMGKFPGFAKAIEMLHELGLLQIIFPELCALTEEGLKKRIQYIPDLPDNTPTIGKLLELFPLATIEEKLALCDRFKLSNADRDFVRFHHSAQKALEMDLDEIDAHDWAHLYAHPHFEICLHGAATRCLQDHKDAFIQTHENQIQQLEPFIFKIKKEEPLIRAKDLIKKGISPGPKMGELLKKAHRIAINEKLFDIEAILSKLGLD